jgi:hypothetical protein
MMNMFLGRGLGVEGATSALIGCWHTIEVFTLMLVEKEPGAYFQWALHGK